LNQESLVGGKNFCPLPDKSHIRKIHTSPLLKLSCAFACGLLVAACNHPVSNDSGDSLPETDIPRTIEYGNGKSIAFDVRDVYVTTSHKMVVQLFLLVW
jgi:hypothetical protein